MSSRRLIGNYSIVSEGMRAQYVPMRIMNSETICLHRKQSTLIRSNRTIQSDGGKTNKKTACNSRTTPNKTTFACFQVFNLMHRSNGIECNQIQ